MSLRDQYRPGLRPQSRVTPYTGSAGDPALSGAYRSMTPFPAPRPAAQVTPEAPAAPAPQKHPLGWSDNFAASVNTTRALKQFKAGSFVNNLEQGQNERSAARNAYASTNLAAANMGTGNAFLNQDLATDWNARENAQSSADADKTRSESSKIASEGFESHQRGILAIPAQVASVQAATNRSNQMLPYDTAAADIKNRGAAQMLPYGPMAAEAEIGQTRAGTVATLAGADQVKGTQDQLKAATQRITHLERLLNQRQGAGGDPIMAAANGGAPAGGTGLKPMPRNVAEQILNQFGSDADGAEAEARRMGYDPNRVQ